MPRALPFTTLLDSIARLGVAIHIVPDTMSGAEFDNGSYTEEAGAIARAIAEVQEAYNAWAPDGPAIGKAAKVAGRPVHGDVAA
jgi:hypothetical protein